MSGVRTSLRLSIASIQSNSKEHTPEKALLRIFMAVMMLVFTLPLVYFVGTG